MGQGLLATRHTDQGILATIALFQESPPYSQFSVFFMGENRADLAYQ
jgi:hypothetical protein